MTKISNNPLLVGASGKLGNVVVYKQWQGQILMTNKPKKRKHISRLQKQSNGKFKEAAQWAKHILKKPEYKAAYTKGIAPDKNCAYRVALIDYMTAPIVHYVRAKDYSGTIGDSISIKATDDFKVTEVSVFITNAKGALIEQGKAVQNPRKRFMWKYLTTVKNENVGGTVIKAVAFDTPGNRTELGMVVPADGANRVSH